MSTVSTVSLSQHSQHCQKCLIVSILSKVSIQQGQQCQLCQQCQQCQTPTFDSPMGQDVAGFFLTGTTYFLGQYDVRQNVPKPHFPALRVFTSFFYQPFILRFTT